MGYSFGGYYSSRVAAFEKRYAACIALSALHWDLAAWQQKIKDANRNAPKSVAQSNFQWRWVAGAKDEDEGIEIAKKFSLKDVAKNITCPFLVTHAGNDRVVPVENAQKLYDAVGSTNKTIKIFTTEEGGAEHAHVDNRQVGIDFAADWLAENMKIESTHMANPIPIRMGGYGPPTTGFSKSMKFIGDRLEKQFGDRIDVKYCWNIMDFGYKAEEILWLVESGLLTLGYQSSSYLTDRVPELSFVDLPFLFRDNDHARGAMDGALGRRLVQAIESKCNFRILGWYENGFRHISNRVRTVRTPADLKGIAHPRAAEPDPEAHLRAAWRASRMIMDLTDAIRMIKAGEIDAQENPLTNTVTYGVHKFHRFHTISNHFYISRPIFLHRPTFDAWPADLKEAMQKAVTESVAFQRELHVKEEEDAESAIKAEGCEIVDARRRAARRLRRRGPADLRRGAEALGRRAV